MRPTWPPGSSQCCNESNDSVVEPNDGSAPRLPFNSFTSALSRPTAWPGDGDLVMTVQTDMGLFATSSIEWKTVADSCHLRSVMRLFFAV
jgi:hypothetical protein